MLKRDRNYDPEMDRRAKVDELRGLYKKVMAATSKEGGKGSVEHEESVSDSVSTYFEWEKIKGGSGSDAGTLNGNGKMEKDE